MDEIPEARELSDATVEEMVRVADPAWEVEDVTPAERGFCSVYRIEVTGEDAPSECYLKASPDGDAWNVPAEARIQAVLSAHTQIPVPEVLCVVDDHDTLPTPYYLMRALPGEELAYERVCRLADDVLRRLARELGEHLGELHSIPAVDRFGHVGHEGPELAGGRPGGDPAMLAVSGPRGSDSSDGDSSDGDSHGSAPYEDWPSFLREYGARELDRHASSRFTELTPAIRRWFDAAIGDLDGPFEPVLGRNDHGLHNLLVDPETGEITAMLDWGYTLSVPAAFDVEFAVYLFGGAFLAGLSDVPDRRSLVREELLLGYRSTAPERVEAISTPEPLYELLAMVRIMNDFHHLEIPDGTEPAAMDRIQTDARALLDRDPRR